MAVHSEGARPSLWEQTAELPMPPVLDADAAADVCVIGAGMAGLSTAYELVQTGLSVIVLDDGPIAGGETGRTTAHVATSFDDYYHEVERMHGEAAGPLLGASFRAAVDRIEAIVAAESIDCDWRRVDGWWYAPPGRESDAKALRDEQDAAHRAGFPDVELLEHPSEWPLAGTMSREVPAAVLRFPRQGQFHAVRYVAGLAAALTRRGGKVYTGAHVIEVTDGDGDTLATVKTQSGHTVRARDVVVATNSPFNDRVAMHTKQAPYRTYVIAARIAKGAVPVGLYWDTLDPYHYIRLLAGQDEAGLDTDVLIVGGEDHKTGQETDENAHFTALEQWTRERFPIADVVSRWSGQVMEPVDYVAYIGRNPGDAHIWIATGDSGNGITHGALAGLLLRDLIRGTDNPWTALFDPSRISLRAAGTWIAENANVAKQYLDLVTPGEATSIADVPAGQGRIVRDGLRKLAVYRDESGAMTVRSAVCPHLGCIVDWNAAEKTWDCPCHGSRFALDGEVLNGPAICGLAEAAGDVEQAETKN